MKEAAVTTVFRWLIAALLLAACSHQNPPVQQPAEENVSGYWEMSVTIQTDPADRWMTSPITRFGQCLRDVKYAEQVAQLHQSGDGNCKTSHTVRQGNTFSWTRICRSGDGDVIYKGENTFHGDTMTGWQDITRKGHTMRNLYQGKRVRPTCE